MDRKSLPWLALAMTASLIVVALLPTAAQEPTAPADPAAPAEPADPGRDLYLKNCATCHGKDGVATKLAQGSANFNDPKWLGRTSPAMVEKVTVIGVGKMPAHRDKLTPAEIRQVCAYVRTMK